MADEKWRGGGGWAPGVIAHEHRRLNNENQNFHIEKGAALNSIGCSALLEEQT